MIAKLFKHKISKMVFGLLLAAIIFFIINPPELIIAKKGGDFAAQFMLGLLALGLLFLGFRLKTYMLMCFIGSGMLAFFLKTESNLNLVLPDSTSEPKLTVAHFNTSDIEGDIDYLISLIEELNVDIVSFQEVTPDWNMILKERMSKTYNHHKSVVRIDPFGMAMYSKKPLISGEVFDHGNIPNLNICLNLGNKKINLIGSYILPPFTSSSENKAKAHLNTVSTQINSLDNPVISLGDFNLVYWSNEIRDFRASTHLQNSRRTVSLNSFEVPYNHIFYSNQLECVFFKELRGKNQNRIGIVGTYQFVE